MSLRQKIVETITYCFITASLITAGAATAYIKGYNRGEKEGEKIGKYFGEIEGLSKRESQGYERGKQLSQQERQRWFKEGYEQGTKEAKTEFVINSVDLHKPNTPALREISEDEYYKRLFVYELERQTLMNACELVMDNYLEQGRTAEYHQLNSLRLKCNAEIHLIEEEFKKRK